MKKFLLFFMMVSLVGCSEFVAKTKSDVADHINRGAFAKAEFKDYAGAIQEYGRALELDPKNLDAYLGRGSAKAELHDYPGAIQDFKKAMELDPESPHSYYNLGIVKGRMKDFAEAIRYFNRAIEIEPKHAQAYFFRGLVKTELQDYAGALVELDRAVELGETKAKEVVGQLREQHHRSRLYSAHSQELKAIIFVSNQPEFLDQSEIVREYVIGETAFCTFFVQGFSADSMGQANLTADIILMDPGGNILLEENNFAQQQSTFLKDQEIIPLSNVVDLTFEETDPLGMYKLRVRISDHIANTKDEAEITLLLFDTAESKELIMTPVRDAQRLDELWAEYFRSKNPWAVKRVISALRLREGSPHAEDALMAEAAKWSLETNLRRHPEVLSTCKQLLEYTEGIIKELLAEIISNVEKEN